MGRRLALWPVTQVLHAGAMVEPLLPDATARRTPRRSTPSSAGWSWYRSGEAWGPRRGERPRYADDVAWVGLALLGGRRERGTQPLPDDVGRALGVRDGLRGARRRRPVARGRRDPAYVRHRARRAPGDAAAPARPPIPEPVAFARRSMAWLDATLRRDDDRYGDHANGAPDLTTWAYNQGEPAVAWDLLAAEGDPRPPRALADRTVQAAVRWLAGPEVLWDPAAGVRRDRRAVPGAARPDRRASAPPLAAPPGACRGRGHGRRRLPRRTGRAGRYGDDVAIDLAGLIQMAAAVAGPVGSPRYPSRREARHLERELDPPAAAAAARDARPARARRRVPAGDQGRGRRLPD